MRKMREHDLIESIEKHSGMSRNDASNAVKAVLGALRSSQDSAMVLRQVEGKVAPIEQRKIIHLCG
jgi:nucleoid DNA-binding protein